MSWWNSVETVTAIWQTARIAVVVCISVSLVVALLEMVAGRRAESLRAEAAAAQQRAWQQQITFAETTATQATTEIAKASTEIERYTRQAAAAEAAANEAKRRAAEAAREAAEAAERLKPRSLTPEQRRQFRDLTLALPKSDVELQVPAGDQEAERFAVEIAQMLVESGWPVRDTSRAVFAAPPTGLILQIRDKDAQPAAAGILQKAFEKIGFTVPGGYNPTVAVGMTRLIIGKKS
jgi:hypothetical protein